MAVESRENRRDNGIIGKRKVVVEEISKSAVRRRVKQVVEKVLIGPKNRMGDADATVSCR